MVDRLGTARGDLLVGTPRDDYFEDRGVSNRPPNTTEVDTIQGGAGFDSMRVGANSSCTFVGSAGTGAWSVLSSNGDTNVSATGIEEVYFSGSSQNDVFNTGDATGSVFGNGGSDDVDIWIANFSAFNGNVRFGINSAADNTVAGMTVQQVEQLNLTTGGGNDVITGGFAGDTITSGAGNDRIDAGTRRADGTLGADAIDCGLGRDTLVVHAELEQSRLQVNDTGTGFFVQSDSARFLINAADTEFIEFSGGAGDDIIDTGDSTSIVRGGDGMDFWKANLSATKSAISWSVIGPELRITDIGLKSVGGVERVELTLSRFADTLTGGAEGDTINGGDGNDVVDLRTRRADGTTGADVFNAGRGVDTLIVDARNETQGVSLDASANDFFVRSGSARFLVDAYDVEKVRFTGGSGADVIESGARGERIDGRGGLDLWIADYSATKGDLRFVTPGDSGGESMAEVGLLSITGIDRIELTTGGGDDTVIGGAEGDTVTGGSGNDVVDLKTRRADGSTGTDVFNAGRGVDTLIVNCSRETKGVSLDASGSDFFVRSGSARFSVDAYDVEKVRFTGGSGDDVIESGARGEIIDARGGIDRWIADYSATAKNIAFSLGEVGTLSPLGLTSIRGVESMTFTAGKGDDRIAGGAYADTIYGGAGRDAIDAGMRGARGTESGDFVDGGAGVDTLVVDASQERQSVQTFLSSNGTFSVRSSSGAFSVDAVNVEGVRLTGGFAGDSVGGSAGRDSLEGENGADTLGGGLGQDTLDGGSGRDAYLFDTALGRNNVDLVLNFVAKDDVFQLDGGIFTALNGGQLKASQFRTGQAQDGDDHILLQNGRQLFYDPDGDGRQQAVLFANINGGGANITAKDFFVI